MLKRLEIQINLVGNSVMARNKPTPKDAFVMFNVIYEDGTQTSNRKIPGSELGGLEGDAPAQGLIEEQDRKIEEQSGRPRGPIKSVVRASTR